MLGNLAFWLLPMAAVCVAVAERGSWAWWAAAVVAFSTIAALAAGPLGLFGLAQRVYMVSCSAWMIGAGAILGFGSVPAALSRLLASSWPAPSAKLPAAVISLELGITVVNVDSMREPVHLGIPHSS